MKITTFMGIVLFFIGVGGILLGTGGMLGWLRQLELGAQLFLMIGGSILCVLAFIMARDRPVAPPVEDKDVDA